MLGWQKEYPEQAGWYRAVVTRRINEAKEPKHQSRVEFVQVVDTDKSKGSLLSVYVMGELNSVEHISSDKVKIEWFWFAPEVEFSIPYDQRDDRKTLDDLESDLSAAGGQLMRGDLGLLWNMVGRRYSGKDSFDHHIEHAEIKNINPAEGSIQVDRHYTTGELPSFLKYNFEEKGESDVDPVTE